MMATDLWMFNINTYATPSLVCRIRQTKVPEKCHKVCDDIKMSVELWSTKEILH